MGDAIAHEVQMGDNVDNDTSDEDENVQRSVSCPTAFRTIDALKNIITDRGPSVQYVTQLDPFQRDAIKLLSSSLK